MQGTTMNGGFSIGDKMMLKRNAWLAAAIAVSFSLFAALGCASLGQVPPLARAAGALLSLLIDAFLLAKLAQASGAGAIAVRLLAIEGDVARKLGAQGYDVEGGEVFDRSVLARAGSLPLRIVVSRMSWLTLAAVGCLGLNLLIAPFANPSVPVLAVDLAASVMVPLAVAVSAQEAGVVAFGDAVRSALEYAKAREKAVAAGGDGEHTED